MIDSEVLRFRERSVPVQRVREIATEVARSLFRVRAQDFHIIKWVSQYRVSTFLADLSAGAVVAAVLVPQAMAYALLAGLDPVYGLYSSVFPLLIFALLTTSSQVSPGPNGEYYQCPPWLQGGWAPQSACQRLQPAHVPLYLESNSSIRAQPVGWCHPVTADSRHHSSCC